MSKFAPSSVSPGGMSSTFVPGASEPIQPLVRPELVQRHLEKVVVSAEMCRSKKLCQFLRFTVEEVLRGHGSELKEYAIAVGVFKRNREFDPGADPIVRPDDVKRWFDDGVRIIGLSWSQSRYAGGTRAPGPLSDDGKKLLKHFGRLPATLTISLLNTSPPSVVSATTTIKQKQKQSKHHH